MSFNALDVVLVAVAVLAGFGGYRLGMVTRAASWLGLAVGVAVGARLVPTVVRSVGPGAGRAQLAVVAVTVLVGAAFAGQVAGLLVGSRAHLAMRSRRARQVDQVGGAALGVLGVLVAVWLVVPAAADVPGWQARQVRTSRLARAVEDVFPPAPNATRTLRRILGGRYPTVFESLRPAPDLAAPPAASGLTGAVAEAVAASTVKVVGEACGRIQEGSGFVAAPELVVTNAHVVAGQPSTVLQRDDGSEVDADVVAFDPARDLAVLRAPGIGRDPLPIGDIQVGGRGGVFGHPRGGPLRIAPFAVGQEITAVGRDIYGADPTRRDVLVLSSSLAPGDSGAPLVDPIGAVVGVAFAIAPDRPGVAYALTTGELQAVLSAGASAGADTGSCVA